MRSGLLIALLGLARDGAGIAVAGPLVIVALVWLVYFAFLHFGMLPGGKPPAWEAGEAVPWPTPGEKAAAELEPAEGWARTQGARPRRPAGRPRRRVRAAQAQAARVAAGAKPAG